MLRALIIVAILLSAGVSQGLDWDTCGNDLKVAAKLAEEAGAATAGLRQAYDLYDDKRLELTMCKDLGGDCQYLQLTVNGLLVRYNEERKRFTETMQALNRVTAAMKGSCGYQFK